MNLRTVRQIIKDSPLLRRIDGVQRVRKGFSRDAKYLLSEGHRPRFLLRFSGIESRQLRQQEFDIQRRLHDRGVPCPKPHVFAVAPGDEACYAIFGYLPGESAQDSLPAVSASRQFAAGVAAGVHLRQLHQVRCPQKDFDWYGWQCSAYHRQVARACERKLTFLRQDRVEQYVEANMDLMRDAPVRFLHADYHPANLILRSGRFAGIVDFNRFRWGDPAYEFKMLPLLTCYDSVAFARGQLHGYFPTRIPREIWRRYNLYVMMSLHVTLVWSQQYDPKRLNLWRRRIQEILDSHDLQRSGPPAWFARAPARP